MQSAEAGRQKRFHSIDAIVSASFSEGICPDLISVVELSQCKDKHFGSSSLTASAESLTLQQAKPGGNSKKSKKAERYHSFSGPTLYSSEPNSLDSPDGVFSNSRFPRLGFFSAVTRRQSAPINKWGGNSEIAISERKRVGKRSKHGPSPIRIIISTSGEDSPTNLRKASRDFGSEGDLLDEPRPLNSNSYRKFLGKSLQQVSHTSSIICSY